MIANFPKALEDLLAVGREGGFSNHPADPGGMTNHGVTLRVWSAWVGRDVTEAEMRALTHEDVAPLYRERYWDTVKADQLPSGLDYAVFDAAVNSGSNQASKWLQRSVNAADDGRIGPMTLKAVSGHSAAEVVTRFNEQRQNFLEGLKTFATFGNGWTRRVSEVQTTAMLMTKQTEA